MDNLPTRKQLRAMLQPMQGRPRLARSLFRFIVDAAIWLSALPVVAVSGPVWAKLCGSIVLWLWSARLFIIGHDACHGSCTRRPLLNACLGRVAFLPTLTPYSLWAIGHNVIHDGYNNLRGHDYVWAPLSPEEYRAASKWRRAMQRIYRSGYAPGLYYLIELWWKKLSFPNRQQLAVSRPSLHSDCWLSGGFLLLWMGVLYVIAKRTDHSVGQVLVLGFVVPFLLWNWLIGFVIHVHHTHETAHWYKDKKQWAQRHPYLTETAPVRFGRGFNRLLHNIFEHTAHHIDTSIPMFDLPRAQQLIEEGFGQHPVRTRPSPAPPLPADLSGHRP